MLVFHWLEICRLCHICAMPTDGVGILPSSCAISIESGTKIYPLLPPTPPLALCFLITLTLVSYSIFLYLCSNIFYLCYPFSLNFIFLFCISIDFLLKLWRVLRKMVVAETLRKSVSKLNTVKIVGKCKQSSNLCGDPYGTSSYLVGVRHNFKRSLHLVPH